VPPGESPGASGHHPHRRSPQARTALWILGALLLAIATINLPSGQGWLAVKAFAVEVAGILLAVLVVSRGEWTWARARAALTAAPNLMILLFLAWVGVSVVLSDLPMYSRYEGMRHLGGALIYFGVVYGLSVRRHLERFVNVLLLAGSLAAVLAFINYSDTDASRIAGAFREEQLLAAFLSLQLPLVLMASHAEQDSRRRIPAQVAVVILLAGLLVTQNRSAWIGALLAAVTVVGLHLAFGRPAREPVVRKHTMLVPALMVVLAVGLFFFVSRQGGILAGRAGTLAGINRDESFQWRRGMWDKALRMVRDRPLLGWGVGTFGIQQVRYYHPAIPLRQQIDIVNGGPSLSENAHNTYLQLTADLGIPGLILYLGVFVTFFGTALRALRGTRPGFRQAMLIGAVGAIVAQMASAVGNPSWEYAECSVFLWLTLGLGMALSGVGDRGRFEVEE